MKLSPLHGCHAEEIKKVENSFPTKARRNVPHDFDRETLRPFRFGTAFVNGFQEVVEFYSRCFQQCHTPLLFRCRSFDRVDAPFCLCPFLLMPLSAYVKIRSHSFTAATGSSVSNAKQWEHRGGGAQCRFQPRSRLIAFL
jgi:hypothetical protein